MSPREAPIKVIHLYVATAMILAGMYGMVRTDGYKAGEQAAKLDTVVEQMKGLRHDITQIALKVDVNSQTNVAQAEQIRQLQDGGVHLRGRSFDR